MSETLASGAPPVVSIVVPVRNEAGNIAPLVDEIATALGKDRSFEIIYVNDGSTDRTESELSELMASRPWLRQIKHRTSCGQSAAVSSGVLHARAGIVVTLDGDGQNDPAFIPALLEALAAGALLVRDWFAARGLAFTLAPDGAVRPMPGPSFARIKRVARQLIAP